MEVKPSTIDLVYESVFGAPRLVLEPVLVDAQALSSKAAAAHCMAFKPVWIPGLMVVFEGAGPVDEPVV